MSETLEEKLAKIERGDAELQRYFMKAAQSDPSMYVSDFIIFGALKRTLALSEGFRSHIRERNFTCAGALLRLQLDTALRLHAARLSGNPEAYAKAVFEGQRVDRLKDRDGNRMTDSYLAQKLSEEHPWVKRAYEGLCDFIHFSNRHFFTSIANLNSEERIVHFQISAKDPPRPESDYFESVDGFYETMRLTLHIAAAWHMVMHAPERAAVPPAA